MALFVILIGALLILGGGSSLIAGFDITMTERGSAMTIAGTVALTGGAITVAIGFSLLRLSQILNVLQINVEDEAGNETAPSQAASHTVFAEPEVAVTSAKTIETATALQAPKVDVEDTILTSPLTPREAAVPPRKAGFFKKLIPFSDANPALSNLPSETVSPINKTATGLATAGLATAGLAGAAILASGTASARTSNTDLPSDLNIDLNGNLDSALDDAATDIAQPAVEPPEAALQEDLEAELSRALAEDMRTEDMRTTETFEPESATELADLEPDDVPKLEPISFNEGLTNVLSKPKRRGKKQSTPAEAYADSEFQQDLIESSPLVELNDIKLDAQVEDENSESQIILAETNEDAIESIASEISKETSETSEERPTILGTYNAGNGTYVMYSDGTVEAIMEQGIRKFKSMEELRHHLSQS